MRMGINCSLRLVFGVSTLLVLAGCGGGSGDEGESVPENPQEAATQLEKTFDEADQETQKQASQASQALRSNDYVEAADQLNQLQQREDLSFDQKYKVRNSMAALQSEIAEALESGDPQRIQRAKEAAERFRQMQQQGR